MQQDELTFHPSYNQQVHLFVKGYLLSGLEQQDQFSYLAELFTFLYQVRTRIVWMAVLCPLSSICLAVYLLHACGRRHDQEGIVLGFQERIPLDLYLAVTGTAISLLVCLAIDLIETSIHMPLPLAFALMLACLLAGAALLMASILTLVVRGKYGHGYWWRHTVCFYVLRFVYRLCRPVPALCGQGAAPVPGAVAMAAGRRSAGRTQLPPAQSLYLNPGLSVLYLSGVRQSALSGLELPGAAPGRGPAGPGQPAGKDPAARPCSAPSGTWPMS